MTFKGQARGYKGVTLIDFEDSFKEEPAIKAGKLMPINSNTVVSSQGLGDPGTITGTRNSVEPYRQNISVDGDIVVPLDYKAIGFWLKAIFGDPTTTDNLDGTFTHVFKISDFQPSLIIERGYADVGQYFLYHGCKIGSFRMPFGGDSEATVTLSILGAKETIESATYDSSAPKIALERASQFQAAVKEMGSEAANVIKDGEINLDMGLDGEQYCVGDGGTRGDIPESIINISGSFNALFKDRTFVDRGIKETISSLELNYVKDTNKLSFLFPEIVYERTAPPLDGPSGVVVSCNWRAFWGTDSNESAVVVTLTNDVEEY